MKTLSCCILSALTASLALANANPDKIECEGVWKGHLQGVASDGDSIWWSYSVQIVRTDMSGKVICVTEAPGHQGDLCLKDGIIYTAVGRGVWNCETGAVSEVSAWDASTLKHLKTWAVPEVVHSAGGMTVCGDRFFVVGGLPATHNENYVYEYDRDFKFVRRHVFKSYNWLGFQTAAYENGRMLFSFYGYPGNPAGLYSVKPDFSDLKRYDVDGSVGMVTINGSFYTGWTYAADKGGSRGELNRTNLTEDRLHCERKGRGTLLLVREGTELPRSPYRYGGDCHFTLGSTKDNMTYVPESKIAGCKKPHAVEVGPNHPIPVWDIITGLKRIAETGEMLSLLLSPEFAASADYPKILKEADRLGITIRPFASLP